MITRLTTAIGRSSPTPAPITTALVALLLLATGAVAQTRTWTGTVDTLWDNGANWSPTGAPTAFDNAIIGTGTFQPATYTTNPSCNDFTVNAGASLSLATGFTLTVNGAVSVLGSFDIATGSTVLVSGDWSSNTTGASVTGDGTVEFGGTGSASTGTNTIPNVLISTGTRTFYNSLVAGDLQMTDGQLRIDRLDTLTVQGDASLSGGSLYFSTHAIYNEHSYLEVQGDVVCNATVASFNSRGHFRCGGNWSSGAAFTGGTDGNVELIGLGNHTVAGPTLGNLRVQSGTYTLSTPMVLSANLRVDSGATWDTNAAMNIDGTTGVTLGDGTAAWDIGSFTHTVSGGWTTSGASATGSGWIEFDGGGTTITGSATIPNVRVSSGTRWFNNSVVAGDLEVTGGQFGIFKTRTVTVGGTANLTGGGLYFETHSTYNQHSYLVVQGNVSCSATVNQFNTRGHIRCGGDWTSTATFSGGTGNIELFGTGTHSVSGPTLGTLRVEAGTHVLTTPLTLSTNLYVEDGATWDTDAPMDINGGTGVILGDGTAVWDIGSFTHTVKDGWTTSGASATGSGWIEFDGGGTTITGSATIPNVRVSSGTRWFNTSVVAGDLEVTSGDITFLAGQTITVNGDADMSGGTLTWSASSSSHAYLVVHGDVSCGASVVTFHSYGHFRCGGDWSSTAAFSGGTGNIELFGTGTHGVSGPTLGTLRVEAGTHVLTTPLALAANLYVESGATWDTDAPMDINGTTGVTLGDGTTIWDIGSFAHTIKGGWTTSGASPNGSGWIEFDGNGTTTTGSATIPNVRVSGGTRWFNTSAVAGDLEVTGGQFGIFKTKTVTVGGEANLIGGALYFETHSIYNQHSYLVVQGNVSCSATVNQFNTRGHIRCGGDWTSTATFSGGTGNIELFGTGTHNVSGPTLGTLRIEAGTYVLTTPLALSTNLYVENGATWDTDAPMDINGGTGVILGDGTAVWDIGSFTHTVDRGWTTSGASAIGSGWIEFDGSATTITGSATLPNVRVSAGTRWFNTSTVAGDLEVTGGQFGIYKTKTVTVGGDANLIGGGLYFQTHSVYNQHSYLIVQGDVTCTATAVQFNSRGHIHCGGDWASNSAFTPGGGKVYLQGIGTTTVSGIGPGFDPTFSTLYIRNGARVAGNDFTLHVSTLNLEGTGALDVASRQVAIPSGTVTASGQLSVGAGGTLALGSAANATVSSSGTLSVIGAPGSLATIAGSSGGGYSLTVNGTLAARNYVFQEMGTAGLVINNGATLAAPPNDLRGGTFTLPWSSIGSRLLTIYRPVATELRYVHFENPLAHPDVHNVYTTAASATVSFVNWGGAFGGAAYEDDAADRIDWDPPEATVLASFTATAGSEMITLDWQTTAEADIDSFVLESSTSAGGPFSLVTEVLPTGPGLYQVIDQPLTVGVEVFYRLSERLTHGPVNLLASDSAIPTSTFGPDITQATHFPGGVPFTPEAGTDYTLLEDIVVSGDAFTFSDSSDDITIDLAGFAITSTHASPPGTPTVALDLSGPTGADNVTITGPGSFVGFDQGISALNADNLLVDGVSFTGIAGTSAELGYGIYVGAASPDFVTDCRILNCTLADFPQSGILLERIQGVGRVTGNDISGCGMRLLAPTDFGAALAVIHPDGIEIEGNHFHQNAFETLAGGPAGATPVPAEHPTGTLTPAIGLQIDLPLGLIPAGTTRLVSNVIDHDGAAALKLFANPHSPAGTAAPVVLYANLYPGGAFQLALEDVDSHWQVDCGGEVRSARIDHDATATPGAVLSNTITCPMAHTTLATGTMPCDVVVGDVVGTAAQDVVVSNSGDDGIAIYEGDGLGGFLAPTIVATGTDPRGIALGDVNGDAVPDIVVCNYGDGTLGVLDGASGFTAGIAIDLSQFPFDMPRPVACVVQADGDVAVADEGLGIAGPGRVFDVDVDALPSPLVTVLASGGAFTDVIVGDFNNDLLEDIAASNSSTTAPGGLTILFGGGGSTTAAAGFTLVAIETLGGDDIVSSVQFPAGTGGTTVWENDGSASFTPNPVRTSIGGRGVAVGDFNGGRADFVDFQTLGPAIGHLGYVPAAPASIRTILTSDLSGSFVAGAAGQVDSTVSGACPDFDELLLLDAANQLLHVLRFDRFAHAATVLSDGTGDPGYLIAASDPYIGSFSFALSLDAPPAAGFTSATLILQDQTAAPFGPLPLVAPVSIIIDPASPFACLNAFTDAAGDASFLLPINPNFPCFACLRFAAQWVVYDGYGVNGGLSISDGVRITLGAVPTSLVN